MCMDLFSSLLMCSYSGILKMFDSFEAYSNVFGNESGYQPKCDQYSS